MNDDVPRSLGIDLGEARIGLALSDPLGWTAQPLETIPRIGPRKDLQRIDAIVREHQVATVVVGLPLLMSGESGAGAVAAREFVDRLSTRMAGVEVTTWDERLTTVEAERVMIAGGAKRNRRRRSIDQLAAVLILQGFLDARRNRAGVDG